MRVRFCWGLKDGEKKMYWVVWNKMSVFMSDGDLGFSYIEFFNEVMFVK